MKRKFLPRQKKTATAAPLTDAQRNRMVKALWEDGKQTAFGFAADLLPITRRKDRHDRAPEELLLAAEALAEAVDDYRDLAQCSAPEREDFDSHEEFLFAVECYEDDRKDAADSAALRDYRWAQQRELSQRVIRLNSSLYQRNPDGLQFDDSISPVLDPSS